MEKAGEFFRKANHILTLSHPRRSAYGMLIGVILNACLKLFSPVIKNIDYVDTSAIGALECIAIGIVFMHIKTIINFFSSGSPHDEEIEKVLLLIDEIKKQGIPEWQKKQMYMALFNKVLENVNLNKETRKELEQLKGTTTETQTGE